jgi:hypothetical protein
MKRALVLFLALSIGPVAFAAPAAPKVEMIGACSDASVPDAVRGELSPQGYRVVGDAGTLAEVWFRKVIPQKGAGGDYSTLQPGTFVGVIRYPAKGGDYRGQAVRAGTYTMRYQTIPQDGNHLGVSPSADFVLLAPAAEDKDPKAVVPYEELIRLSKLASGTGHPNPLHLATPAGGAPAFRLNEEGHGALEVKLRAQPGGGAEADLPFAILLIGKSEG